MNGCYSNDMPTTMENSRNCLRRIARHDDQEFSNQSILNAMEKFVKNVNTMDETILVPCRLMDRKVGDATDTVPVAPKAQHSGAHHGKKTNRASIREVLNTSELFQLYNMLKLVKVDLLWGRQDADDSVDEAVVMGATTTTSAAATTTSAAATTKTTSKGRNSSISEQSLTREGSPVATAEKADASGSNSTSTSSSSNSNSNSSNSGSSSPAATVSGTPKGHTRRPSTVSVTSSNSASTLSDSESEASAENDSGIESEGNQEQDRSAELAKQFRTHLLGLYRSLEQMSEAANYLTTRYQSDVGPV